MEEKQTLRIVMLGKTGAGKSSLANTIYGEKGKFEDSASPNSETKECHAETTKINGRNINLIDTPGLFDTDLQSTELSSDILKCIEECAPGPHAFLIVLKVEKYTPQEQDVVDKILKYFSEEALNFTTVVFTHGDDLPEGVKVKDWASKNKALKTLIDKCGGHVHVFDNKRWNNSQDPYRNNQYQVQELLKSIEETEREKDGKYYTNKYLEFMISIKKMGSVITYPAGVLLGALLGAEKLAKKLTIPEQKERRILLLGKTGCGKSSLANTIFQQTDQFKTLQSPKSITKECKSVKKEIDGKIIQLIDTPGFYDASQKSVELYAKIINSLKMCAPGPHAFLVVLKVERYSAQEEEVVKKMLKCFSKDAFKYTTVVFTHGDQLDEGTNIEDWISESEALKTLIQECGGRVHVFDNKYWNNSQDPYRNNQYQVTELLKTIDQTVEKNRGRHFTNGFWQRIKNLSITGIPLKVLWGLILGGIVFSGIGVAAAAAANMSMSGVVTVGVVSGLAGGGACAGVVTRYPEASEAVRETASDALSSVRSRVKALGIEAEKYKKL